jgi:tetratricopeptide (TPR) repeat protein
MRKLATILIVLATASAADAKPKPKGNVKVHMDKAAKAHKAGKFEVALTELQAAYEIDPQPRLLFAIAQVYAKLDNCEAAIEHYEKFNAATKDKSKQTIVKQAIDACKAKLADKADKADKPDKPDKPDKGDSVFRAKKPPADELPTAEAKPEPEQKVETTPPPVEPVQETKPEPVKEIKAFDEPPPKPRVEPIEVKTTTTSTRKPWYRDPLGDALVITGVGATIGSFFTYRAAQSELDAAEDSTTLKQYDDHHNAAERNQLYTIVLAGGGIALVTAGVLRYTLRSNGRESGVAIVPRGGGGLITWSRGF